MVDRRVSLASRRGSARALATFMLLDPKETVLEQSADHDRVTN
ncbi:hypothetical protein NJ7G_2826 [Natrinema sp. J7-2]|uniref:Uncharacterized protein n=1 Tax=Natrinema gari JCM 14663 TaxID=1230459 RepID=L9Z4C0_9EURY|nr:hypothetical protein NJ7G_2826 [Natrinema sp. J7-2]ELY80018.1 hypothetical protein C486_09900 [Natrinema gari JCM 14663]